MSDSKLSQKELDALLDGAEIIYDDTKQYLKGEGKERKDREGADVGEIELDRIKDLLPNEVDVRNMDASQKHNSSLLLDIYVQVTVELGRTNIHVKDVLALGEGSIIELAKPANEPVDLLVNDRLIAHGEVVVIDENFGTRVTNIALPAEQNK